MERLEEVTHRLRGERAHSSCEFCSEHGRVVFRPFREARLRPHVLPFGGSEPLVGLGMHKARSHDESQRERGIPVRWIAYRTGRVTYGGEGLRRMPIIDYRGYVDQPENGGEVHSRFHSFSMRQRLLEANGTFENHIMLVEDGLGPTGLFGDASPVLSHALTQMDEWLTSEISLRGSLDDEQRQRLLEIAERCPVHRTLTSEVTIRTRLVS